MLCATNIIFLNVLRISQLAPRPIGDVLSSAASWSRLWYMPIIWPANLTIE